MIELSSARRGPIVVAIPARDEEQHIGSCLDSLYSQTMRADHIVVFANNCADATAAAALRTAIDGLTQRHVIERVLPPAKANAGHARRLAMQAAARLAGRSGILLTTDADSRAEPDWLEANVAALNDGADAVAGTVELDPLDWGLIPQSLHEDDARECAYDALCDEIQALLDPDPADPWPRHTNESGASIAVTAETFCRAGGIPDVVSGEDRAFFASLRRIDARVRHAPECRVFVSGRTDGRAAGGMADTIRRRLAAPDLYLDARLEPAADCARRAVMRRTLREAYTRNDGLADLSRLTRLGEPSLGGILRAESFGRAWLLLEKAVPALRRRPVPAADVARQTSHARAIRDALRKREAEAAARESGAMDVSFNGD
jgi:hypothetical protein